MTSSENITQVNLFLVLSLSCALFACSGSEDAVRVNQIKGLFRQTYGVPAEHRIAIWENNFEICISNAGSQRPLKHIELLLDMLTEISSLQYKINNVSKLDDCSFQTSIFINIHKDKIRPDKENKTLNDLTKRYRVYQEFNSDYKEIFLGYGLIIPTPISNLSNKHLLYIGLTYPSVESGDLYNRFANKAIQEEIFQIILAGFDVEILDSNEQSISILQEIFPREFHKRLLEKYPNRESRENSDIEEIRRQMVEAYYEINAKNLCEVDLIMLMTRFPRNGQRVDETLRSYFEFLDMNYNSMAKTANKIIATPKYRKLFVEPC